MATGYTQKIREDRSSSSRDMLADRQTARQTDCNTPQLLYRGGVTVFIKKCKQILLLCL